MGVANMNRRQFIGITAGIGAAAALPSVVLAVEKKRTVVNMIRDMLDSYSREWAEVRPTMYLWLHPEMHQQLVDEIHSDRRFDSIGVRVYAYMHGNTKYEVDVYEFPHMMHKMKCNEVIIGGSIEYPYCGLVQYLT